MTQSLFRDLSTPKNDETSNVYDDIKSELVERDVPADEVTFVHDTDSEAKRKELFSKVRNSQVRVLFGSTQKMGAGTNIQDKLVAVHHLDVGWRPSDITQRNGRIVHQGSQDRKVHMFQYVAEGTLDAYLYQTFEDKQKFIPQIMMNRSPVRPCDDADEQALSYAEIKTLCAGNPMIKEKTDLDTEVARLKVLKTDHQSKQYRLEDQLLTYYPAEVEKFKGFIRDFEKDIEAVEKNPIPEEDFVGMRIGTRILTDKEMAGEVLLATCKNYKDNEAIMIGEYRESKMELPFDSSKQEYELTLRGEVSHRSSLGTDARGSITRMNNAPVGISNRLERTKTQLDNPYHQEEVTRLEVGKPFPQEAEFSQKSAGLVEPDVVLSMDDNHSSEEINEEKPSVIAELKKHSSTTVPDKNCSDDEVSL